jgi:hypothetical protein
MLSENRLSKFSYQVEAFRTLKVFFSKIDFFFKKSNENIELYIKDLPEYLQLFLKEDDFLLKIEEINRHTAILSSFRKRFFLYFNAFKILKYLNFVHPAYIDFADAREQYELLQNRIRQQKNGETPVSPFPNILIKS